MSNIYRKLLLPLDGSNAAEIAIPYIDELAAKLGADVIVVSVQESSDDRSHINEYYLDRVVNQIKRKTKELGSVKPVNVISELLKGKTAPQLVRFADETDVSLIVMSSYGSSGRQASLLGNIASKVLWSTTKPVMLIRKPVDPGLIQQNHLIRKILVPLDGSKTGETIIACAEVVAQAVSAELVLLQVLEPLRTVAGFETVAPYSIPQGKESIQAAAKDYLDNIGKSLKEKDIISSTEIAWGSAAERIIDYSEKNTDLVTISSHGRSGVGRWVFGSVTEKVLQVGDKPVLVARPVKS